MGAKLKSKSGRALLGRLKRRADRLREAVDGVEVVAGFVKGKSSADSIFKAYMNEFGHEGPMFGKGWAKTVPRPFMAQSRPYVQERVHSACELFSARNLKQSMDNIGQAMTQGIEESLISDKFEKLRDSTVRIKGHNTILVESGEMYDNVRSEVRRAK